MFLLNFSHPISSEQILQVQALTGQTIEQVIDLPVQFDNGRPFLPQVAELAASIPLAAAELQTTPILVNPPGMGVISALLMAELHGRMGYFPPIIRLRPIPGSLPPRYEVAEVVEEKGEGNVHSHSQNSSSS